MAYSFVQYTGDGVTTLFSVPFGYIAKSDVTVKVNNVTTSFTWNSDTVVSVSPAPANGAVVEVRRNTQKTSAVVNFQDAGTITEAMLDENTEQMLYITQEAFDEADQSIQLVSDNTWDAESKRIKNVATPTSDNDAANKSYVDQAALGSLPTPLSQANGGTGATSAAAARTALAVVGTATLSDAADLTAGDALVGYRNTGTGSLARTVHSKLDELPSILDWADQAGVEASGKDWIFLPSAQSLSVAGALVKNYWGPGSLALSTGDMPGTQGDALYGFIVLETASAGSGQHFTLASKVFTGARTDTGSAPAQNHCVAGYFEAQRGAGSSDGVWAVNSVTEVFNLSGATIGYEIDVNNASGSDPGLSPANPYIGLSIVSGAAGRGGTAIVVDRNGDFASNHWNRGLWLKEIYSRAIELTNCGSAATGLWTDNTFKMRGTAAAVESVLALIPFDDTEPTAFLFYLANATDTGVRGGWLKRGEISINEPNGKGTAGISIKGIANGDNIAFLQRNTDTSPIGTFIRCVNAANSAVLFDVDYETLAGNTNVLLSVGGAAAVRVSAGAVDSGGAGFKVLRVPN